MKTTLAFFAVAAAFSLVAVAALAPVPAAAAEVTYIDQQAIAYWGDPADDFGDRRLDRRSTFTHINKFCEPDANPPEGWLRKNGFCFLTDQMAKGSLMYLGDDAVFGWDED
jgi:hypothetical protein